MLFFFWYRVLFLSSYFVSLFVFYRRLLSLLYVSTQTSIVKPFRDEESKSKYFKILSDFLRLFCLFVPPFSLPSSRNPSWGVTGVLTHIRAAVGRKDSWKKDKKTKIAFLTKHFPSPFRRLPAVDVNVEATTWSLFEKIQPEKYSSACFLQLLCLQNQCEWS